MDSTKVTDENHVFGRPTKQINLPIDMEKWVKSEGYYEYIGFIENLNEAVKGKSLTSVIEDSPNITAVLNLLEKIDKLIDETPPIDQPQRFGNKAFALFYKKLQENSRDYLKECLPSEFHKGVDEFSVYLEESFGNSTRIDYGTGHEMAFIMFLYCLFRVGVLKVDSKNDKTAAVNKVFNGYLILVRKSQTVYRMEPAGSHGVWSLDDFQFVPFIWGSSQLFGNGRVEPAGFTDENIVEKAASDYMFLGCIKYTLSFKSGPFHEHSNQLWNISGIATWTKINQGLIKMYKAEVLAKFPVIQHVLFGSLFTLKPMDTSKLMRHPGSIPIPNANNNNSLPSLLSTTTFPPATTVKAPPPTTS